MSKNLNFEKKNQKYHNFINSKILKTSKKNQKIQKIPNFRYLKKMKKILFKKFLIILVKNCEKLLTHISIKFHWIFDKKCRISYQNSKSPNFLPIQYFLICFSPIKL